MQKYWTRTGTLVFKLKSILLALTKVNACTAASTAVSAARRHRSHALSAVTCEGRARSNAEGSGCELAWAATNTPDWPDATNRRRTFAKHWLKLFHAKQGPLGFNNES